jgi:amino acid permease
VFNFAKVLVGAGMMALPRAYFLMGSILGTLMLFGMACLVYWTLAVLIDGSTRTGAVTYVGLAQRLCSKSTVVALQAALFLFCFGFMVVHLVVMADLLAGSNPSLCNGLLCEVFGLQSGLLLDRRVLLASIGIFVCAPLMSMRSMDRLSAVNVLGVTANVLLATLAAGLGVAAISQGSAHFPPMWPQWNHLGSNTPTQLIGVAAVAPVILSSYVGHQGVHPIMPILVPYTPNRMKAVVALSLAVAAVTYMVLSLGSVFAFGEGLSSNVLNSMFAESMAPLIGSAAAEVATGLVRGAYLISLLGSALLYMFPLRTCLAEVLCNGSSSGRGGSTGGSSSSSVGDEDTISSSKQDLGTSFGSAASQSSGTLYTATSGTSSTDVAIMIDQESTSATALISPPTAAALPEKPAAAAAAVKGDSCIKAGFSCSAKELITSKAVSLGNVVEYESAAAAVMAASPYPSDATNSSTTAAGVLPNNPAQAFESRYFLLLTYTLLTAAVLVAALVPDIWVALSAIGDCASTLEAFIVPGFIALALLWFKAEAAEPNGGPMCVTGWGALVGRVGYRSVAVLVIGLGVLLFANGVLQEILD